MVHMCTICRRLGVKAAARPLPPIVPGQRMDFEVSIGVVTAGIGLPLGAMRAIQVESCCHKYHEGYLHRLEYRS